VDGRTGEILRPSVYAEMVWEQRKVRAKRDGGSIDWIVMRNRLSNLEANNKREMGEVLDKLAKRIGFRQAPGFSERVIFRELFLQGLTMLDVFDQSQRSGNARPRMSHVAARQEVRALINALQLPEREARGA
jgi:chromosome partitioning protein